MPVNLPLVANVPASALRLNTTTLFLVRHAQVDDPQGYHLLQSIAGFGKVLALVLL